LQGVPLTRGRCKDFLPALEAPPRLYRPAFHPPCARLRRGPRLLQGEQQALHQRRRGVPQIHALKQALSLEKGGKEGGSEEGRGASSALVRAQALRLEAEGHFLEPRR